MGQEEINNAISNGRVYYMCYGKRQKKPIKRYPEILR